MNSRTALAALTAVSLCLGGVATAHANTAAASPSQTAATTTTTQAQPTPTQPASATAAAAPVVTITSTATATASPVTVTETAAPATPTDLGSKIVAASTLSEEGQRFFNVLKAVLSVLGALTQAATVIVAANPEIGTQVAQQIYATLSQWGVQF